MLYYYLRSKRVILSIKYNVQIYEILGNEGLYEMIEHQIKTSSDFTNNSKVKRYKSYKEDLLDYCKDFYNFQLPEDEETFDKYVEYLTKEWNNNLDIQRKEKGYENLQLLDSKFAEVPINVQKEL